MAFVQIIEFSSSRIEEMRQILEEFRARRAETGGPAPVRATFCADRDNPGRYFNLVEFASYEEAMENSSRPDTSEMAQRMAELMDGPPTFHNLDVVESFER